MTREGKVPICKVMKVEILKAEKLKTSGCRRLGTARNGIQQSCTEPNRQQTKKRERELQIVQIASTHEFLQKERIYLF